MYNRSWRDLWRTGNLLIKNECLENTVLKKNVYLHTVRLSLGTAPSLKL